MRLLSRNDLALDGRYPEIAEALAAEPCDAFAVDGEVVAFDGAQTSFAALARRGHARVPVFLYVFDVLWLDGHDVRPLPLRARKRLLRAALTFRDSVRLTPYRNADGEALYAEACRKGWEGVIAKRADSPYAETRSRDWLKFKCERGQEMVVGGWTEPRGSRIELGALLLGAYDGDALRYAGKVGTGFDRATLRDLGERLRRLERPTPRSPTRTRSASAASTGRSPSSSPRSPSRSGRATGGCATRASSACARTRPRARSCARPDLSRPPAARRRP